MFLTEIGNTFTENFELSKLKLKVNGGNYEGDDIKQEIAIILPITRTMSLLNKEERGGCPVSGNST